MYENDTAEYNDTVDPRVHVELERLNSATDEINKLEVELDEARHAFRQLLCDSTAKVDALRAKLGLCVERAKPYYEARFVANEALKQTQVAAMRFERANSAHSAAREMVYLAEQGLDGRTLDPAWQEMLNHATQRVNDAERDRGTAGTEHRIACVRHETVNAKVQSLQKELKRAIAKSSLSIRRDFMKMSSIYSQHELMLLPYYEMKAHFNQLLEQQKSKVHHYETKVSTAKLTYAEALRNLEQISDEIHQIRRRASLLPATLPTRCSKQQPSSIHSSESFLDDAQDAELSFIVDDEDEYKSLPLSLSAVQQMNNDNATTPSSMDDTISGSVAAQLSHSMTSEWTEINLDQSSPEQDDDDLLLSPSPSHATNNKSKKLVKQKTLPNPRIDNELTAIKNRMKLDTNISNWISRSSAKNDDISHNSPNSSRRQSLDNLLGPTGEKVKELFSHGIMMLNISALTERRNSEPKAGLLANDEKSLTGRIITAGGAAKKIPSPLERTLTYLTAEEDSSDTESLSSVDMLNEEQINSLMLDKDIGNVCQQVLGTPISEVVALLPQCSTAATIAATTATTTTSH